MYLAAIMQPGIISQVLSLQLIVEWMERRAKASEGRAALSQNKNLFLLLLLLASRQSKKVDEIREFRTPQKRKCFEFAQDMS